MEYQKIKAGIRTDAKSGRMQGAKGASGSVKRRLRPTTLFLKQQM